jgi:hypothetical protein
MIQHVFHKQTSLTLCDAEGGAECYESSFIRQFHQKVGHQSIGNIPVYGTMFYVDFYGLFSLNQKIV